jgi:hypothetical protein
MAIVVVLGAESQAATSLAVAYPERQFIFVSDRDILDGGDLPNVRAISANGPDLESVKRSAVRIVALCPRWLQSPDETSLTRTFATLERALPGMALPLSTAAEGRTRWVVKGDRWHRPDNPLSGSAEQLADIVDVHGCGLVFQEHLEVTQTFMAIGLREGPARSHIGIVRVFEERYFRDNVLQAAESVDAPDIVSASLQTLDALDHRGYFTLNWLKTRESLRLSSFRPVPRAIFGMFRRGGVDMLASCQSVTAVPAGIRIIAAPTYVSFKKVGE